MKDRYEYDHLVWYDGPQLTIVTDNHTGEKRMSVRVEDDEEISGIIRPGIERKLRNNKIKLIDAYNSLTEFRRHKWGTKFEDEGEPMDDAAALSVEPFGDFYLNTL